MGIKRSVLQSLNQRSKRFVKTFINDSPKKGQTTRGQTTKGQTTKGQNDKNIF